MSELELEICREWEFIFKGIFAKAFVSETGLNFHDVNQEVVDGRHLSLNDLVDRYRRYSS